MVARVYLQRGPHYVDLSKVLGLVDDFLVWWRIYVMGNCSAVLFMYLSMSISLPVF